MPFLISFCAQHGDPPCLLCEPLHSAGVGMPYLQLVGMCCASIEVIEPDACCGEFPLLALGYLYGNSMWQIPPQMFKGNRKLRGVTLNQNLITELPTNLFKDAVILRCVRAHLGDTVLFIRVYIFIYFKCFSLNVDWV